MDAPISAVYGQWTQFESFPQFMGGVHQITQSDDTYTHWVTNNGGVTREFDTDVTEQHPRRARRLEEHRRHTVEFSNPPRR